MIFKSISVLSIVGASSLNAPFASAFSPSPATSNRWSTKQLVSNFGLNAENKEDSNEYGGSSRRDLFKSLPTTAAALTAALGGAASVPKAEAVLSCGTLDEGTKRIIGPLADLVGKWEGNQGFVMIAMPGPGSVPNAPGDFIIRKFPYRETFEICPLVSGIALNRGGSIDQAGGVCSYTKTVWATDKFPNDPEKQTIIHEENGMFFRLDNIAKNPGEPDTGVDVPIINPVPVGPGNQAPFAIGRSAVIPHGNTAMIFGDVKSASGPPIIPDISTLPFTNPATSFPLGYNDPYITPPSVDAAPTKTLKDALESGPAVSNTVHFSLGSKNGPGGVLNTDFIEKRADTREFKADFWVEDLGNGKKQLQYAESATIFFHFNSRFLFFLPKGEIAWPHVMVNTLTKVA